MSDGRKVEGEFEEECCANAVHAVSSADISGF